MEHKAYGICHKMCNTKHMVYVIRYYGTQRIQDVSINIRQTTRKQCIANHLSDARNGDNYARVNFTRHKNKCFSLLMMATNNTTVFWTLSPCTLVQGQRSFRDTNCLHNQNRRRQKFPCNIGISLQ